MWNEPTEKRLSKIPRLYETENVPFEDKRIHLHFFIGSCDWYICEFDGEDLFFGFAILNGDFEMAEWGYISFSELKDVSICRVQIDCERNWKVRKSSKIGNMCKAQGWPLPKKQDRN